MSLPLLFEWVLRSSAMAGILVVFILLVKLLVKDRLGARWHYYIWFLVLLRLLIPVAPESSLSVFNLFTYLEPQENTPVIVDSQHHQDSGAGYMADESRRPELPQSNISVPESESTPERAAPAETGEPSVTTGRSAFSILALIWLAGLTILALYTFTVNFLFWHKIRGKGSVTDERLINLFHHCKEEMGVSQAVPLIISSRVKAITLFGFFHPRLLLPPGIANKLTPDELRCIFFHELAHIKQKDILINWLAGLAQIIHWFNPVIWYAFHRMKQDREVACDALALSYLNFGDYKQYGRVIISLLENFSKTARVPGMIGVVGDNNSNLKKRIRMIALFKKNSYKLSAAAVLLMIVFGVAFLTNASGNPRTGYDPAPEKPGEVRGNTVGNIINEGLVAYDDGWIYYSNLEDEGRLYKKRIDGSGVTLLSNNTARDINVVGDWVYYSNYPAKFFALLWHQGAGGGSIYKVKTDGSEETRLTEGYASSVQVVDDWIYYLFRDMENYKTTVNRMRTDGSEQTIIIDEQLSFDTANLNVVDGWVYYQVVDWDIDKAGDSAGIYKVRVDGSEHMRLTEEHTTIVNVAGDWIYYTGQYGRSIYKMSTDGANQTLLYEGSVSNFNMVDGWIYFVAADAWGNIYRMRTDGSDLERMNNESSGVIFSAGDWLYHSNADDHRKIRKDAPAQALRPREQVSESTVTEDLKQRSLVALGESAFSRISWHFYDKYDAYAEITYTMRLDSDRFDRVIDQAIRELSVLFAELATIPDIDYLIDDLIVEAVHDTNGRVILNIQVDGELLASTDWNNPAVEIIGNISDFDTFTEWWSVERRFFRISVQEEHGTARFIVELFEYNG